MPQKIFILKSDIWSLLIFKLFIQLFLWANLSPESIKEGRSEEVSSSGYTFSNRDFSCPVLKMLIVEIPFVLIEITLMKFKVKRERSLEKKKKQTLKGKICHISIYALLLILIILGFINTIWISMEQIKTDKVKNFQKVFFFIPINRSINI